MTKQGLGAGAAALLVTLAAGANSARADQCSIVTKEIADHASAVLRSGTSAYISYCQPCGDKPPTHSVHAKTIEVKQSGTGYAVWIDGKAVDLAYIFVSVGDYTRYSNLGITSGCKATGITATYNAGTVKPPDAKPANPLAGTWAVTTETQFTTCFDTVGSKSTSTWTIDGTPTALRVNANNIALIGKSDGRNVEITAPPAKSTFVFKLVVQDAKTLSGQELFATVTVKGEACASYRTVTAKKQ